MLRWAEEQRGEIYGQEKETFSKLWLHLTVFSFVQGLKY